MNASAQDWIVYLIGAAAAAYLIRRWWPASHKGKQSDSACSKPSASAVGCGTSCGQCGSTKASFVKFHRPNQTDAP